MKVIELFAGIGACSKALERLGIEEEIVDAVEIDKYAIKSFNAVHGTNFEPQDITKWDKDFTDIDLITHGSPCQDFSLAGKQAGGDIGSGTRSSLMYETIRIVGKIRPKYVLWENVKNVLSKKHKHNFDNYINTMNALGYNSYYQVLNAKDYGIPQNRERVYTVSIRKDIENGFDFPNGEKNDNEINRKYGLYNQATRWGVYDENGLAPTLTAAMGMGGGHVPMIDNFEFPPKQELKLRLKDMLEEVVDEKYYLKDYQIENILKSTFHTNQRRIQEKDYCDTLCARDWKDPKCVRVGGIFDTEKSKHQAGSIYDKEGLAPTLDTMEGGWRQPSVVIGDNNKEIKSFPSIIQKCGNRGTNNYSVSKESYTIPANPMSDRGQLLIEKSLKNNYSDYSIKKIKNNIIEGDVAKTLTANAMQSFNHDNCQLIKEDYVSKKYNNFIEKNGYVPEKFNPYNETEIKEIAPTQSTQCGSTTSSVTVLVKNATKKGYLEATIGDGIDISSRMQYHRGTVQKEMIQTLDTQATKGVIDETFRIRKLTPKECWRLMGFDDEDFDKAQAIPTSNTQLYKQAGNSIVVNVLVEIFRKLFKVGA